MNKYWIIKTHGDPLGAVHQFLSHVWNEANINKMIIPTNGSPNVKFSPNIITQLEDLRNVNPFKPLMTSNTAKFIPELLKENPKITLGAILRPCEMRALVEIHKQKEFDITKLLTICFDCLGTYPAEEYQWHIERKCSVDSLARETLQFARQGGIVSYRFRSACQVCLSPNAINATINIGVIGIPVRQYILIQVQNDETPDIFHFENITDGLATSEMLQQRKIMLAKISERNYRVREKFRQALVDILPKDIPSLINNFKECQSCQQCMEICPLCEVNFPKYKQNGLLNEEDVVLWLVSCVGCGMCEQTCPQHKPLSTIFGYVHEHLNDPLELGL